MKRKFSILITLCMVIMCISGLSITVNAADPIEVDTAAEFLAIQNDPAGNYLITADIDLGTAYGSASLCRSVEFSGTIIGKKPDGTKPVITYTFTHDLYDLEDVGLIGKMSGGKIENIKVTGEIKRFYARAGGIVGSMTGGEIINCESSVDIKPTTGYGLTAGGIVGLLDGTNIIISNCIYNGDMIGNSIEQKYWGGIVGKSSRSTDLITGCSNTGTITNTAGEIGGIAGYLLGKVQLSSNAGAISGASSRHGGIAGGIYGTVDRCFNTGAISGTVYNGGIGGGTGGGTTTYPITITNCYNAGTITSTDGNGGGIAGFIGWGTTANVTIASNYNVGNVVNGANIVALTWVDGSLITEPKNCYLNPGTGSDAISTTGLSAAQMQNLTNYTGFDTTKWVMVESNGVDGYKYPQLKDNMHRKADGSLYTVYTVEISSTLNGEVDKSGINYVVSGSTITVTATPNAQYMVKDIEFNSTPITIKQTSAYIYTSSAITANSTIKAVFDEIPPTTPTINSYSDSSYIFTLSEDVEVNGKIISGPKGITFARVFDVAGYELLEYGTVFAYTAQDIANGVEYEGTNGKNTKGQFGILFYGANIDSGITYYTKPYAKYRKISDNTEITVYGAITSFTPAQVL